MIELASAGSVLGRIDWPGRTSIIHVDDVADAMIALAGRLESAGETFCVASDESLTINEIARAIGAAVGRPVDPIDIPIPLVNAARLVVWNPALQAAMPRFARLPFWRLSLIVSDGFWFDTTKFRRVYTKPLKTLLEGLRTLHVET